MSPLGILPRLGPAVHEAAGPFFKRDAGHMSDITDRVQGNEIQDRIFEPMIEQAKQAYRREHLNRLIAVWPAELNDYTIAGTEHIIERIRKVMLALYRASVIGHWSYDANRHLALIAAFRAETARLAHLKNMQRLASLFSEDAA